MGRGRRLGGFGRGSPAGRGSVVFDEFEDVLAAVSLGELARGVELMGGFGAVDFAAHHGDEEADEELSAGGLLADELREGVGEMAGLVCWGCVGCGEHMYVL